MRQIILILALAGSAFGACSNTSFGNGFTCIQSATGDNNGSAASNSTTAVFGSSVAAGHFIKVSVGWYDFNQPGSAITASVADNCGGVYTQLASATQGSGGSKLATASFEAFNVTGGACTVTATLTANDYISVVASEWSGVLTTDPKDQTGTQNTTSSVTTLTIAAGGATAAGAELVCGGVNINSNATITANAGYTMVDNGPHAPATNNIQVFEACGSIASSGTPTVSLNSSTAQSLGIAGTMATFKGSGAAAQNGVAQIL